jgi:hypothetical protein
METVIFPTGTDMTRQTLVETVVEAAANHLSGESLMETIIFPACADVTLPTFVISVKLSTTVDSAIA